MKIEHISSFFGLRVLQRYLGPDVHIEPCPRKIQPYGDYSWLTPEGRQIFAEAKGAQGDYDDFPLEVWENSHNKTSTTGTPGWLYRYNKDPRFWTKYLIRINVLDLDSRFVNWFIQKQGPAPTQPPTKARVRIIDLPALQRKWPKEQMWPNDYRKQWTAHYESGTTGYDVGTMLWTLNVYVPDLAIQPFVFHEETLTLDPIRSGMVSSSQIRHLL